MKPEHSYTVHSTLFHIKRVLNSIDRSKDIVSFDLETRSIYNKEDKKLAKEYLEDTNLSVNKRNEYMRIVNSSGLSHPSLIKTTHIILGLDEYTTVILIVDEKLELYVFNWLVNTNVKIVIHNSLFDLKIVYYRTGKFPKNYDDTQLMVIDQINDCEDFNRRSGLKVLMGSYYPAKWSIKEDIDYEIDNLKDKNFLEYCHYDGCSCFKLYNQLKGIE